MSIVRVDSITTTDHLCLYSGYRIRELTAAEKEVKVSQLVARQREWEDGLVGVYKRFLEVCEAEVTGQSSEREGRGRRLTRGGLRR